MSFNLHALKIYMYISESSTSLQTEIRYWQDSVAMLFCSQKWCGPLSLFYHFQLWVRKWFSIVYSVRLVWCLLLTVGFLLKWNFQRFYMFFSITNQVSGWSFIFATVTYTWIKVIKICAFFQASMSLSIITALLGKKYS